MLAKLMLAMGKSYSIPNNIRSCNNTFYLQNSCPNMLQRIGLFFKLLCENEHEPNFGGSRGNTLLIKYTAPL